MILFFTIFFLVYSSVNFYVFIRGWQALSGLPAARYIYLVLFIFAASGYILSKVLSDKLPGVLYDIVLTVGAFWFAVLAYAILAVLLIDLIRLLDHWFSFIPSSIKGLDNLKIILFSVTLVIIFIVVLFGHLNTRNIIVTDLNLKMYGKNSDLKELRIAFASDIHLSPVNGENYLEDVVNKLNSLNADIILLGGDIVDDKAKILKERNLGDGLDKLSAKYGVYTGTGNHEFINEIEPSVKYLEDHKINVIRDSVIKIDNAFYLAAREDKAMKNFTGVDRKELNEIVSDLDDDLPVVLLDHTPLNLELAEKNGIALQLSGHTHHGQIWPANIITNLIYEVSWGYLKKSDTQYYVTSGVGTWGPAVRTGSSTEVVLIKIIFE